MGEYFKDERVKETPIQKVELISDFNVLCATYEIVMNKIQETTTQGYEAILPIRNKLSGTGSGPEDVGQIGKLRKRIQDSRIYRMDMGVMMWQALENIEDLDNWSGRYCEYLENHLDSMKLIAKSAFSIIGELQKKIKEDNLEIRKLSEKLVVQADMMPMPLTSKEVQTESSKFRNMLDIELRRYEEARGANDNKMMAAIKSKIFEMCEKDIVKWEIARDEIEIIEKRFKKKEAKKQGASQPTP